MKIKYRVQYEAGFATSEREFDHLDEAKKFDSQVNVGITGECMTIIVYPESNSEWLTAVDALSSLKK